MWKAPADTDISFSYSTTQDPITALSMLWKLLATLKFASKGFKILFGFFEKFLPEITLHRQGSNSFELLKFHDFKWLFAWPFQVFQDHGFSFQFKKFKNLSLF